MNNYVRLLGWLLASGALSAFPHTACAGAARIATGADASPGGPHVKVFTARTLTLVGSFFSYAPSFAGGVRVAVGDVNGDGGPDLITGSGVGAGHVKVFVGGALSESNSFLAYGAGFSAGVFVAAGDINGDGFADIITGADQGVAPHVKVFSGSTGAEIRSFFAYTVSFTGGVRVAAGDVNGDGYADIITGTGPGAAHVKVFDGKTSAEIRSFLPYSTFSGGVFVAAGDVDGDGRADIVTGAGSTSSHVKVFRGSDNTELHSFFAYTAGFAGGVRVAAGDVNGDGRADIITSPGSGMPPQVRVLDGITLAERASFLAYPSGFTNGVFVGASSLLPPSLDIQRDRSAGKVLLSWPSGCLCSLQGNPVVNDPKTWETLAVQPVPVGTRFQVTVEANTNHFFRLICDDEAVP